MVTVSVPVYSSQLDAEYTIVVVVVTITYGTVVDQTT